MAGQLIRIGGASGYWGDSSGATAQLLAQGNLDYIAYDYLAEITLSIMARSRAKNPAMGYAPDFVTSAMAENLTQISSQGTKIISNAGGINPLDCAKALEKIVTDAGLKLKVACITGDDLTASAKALSSRNICEMFTKAKFPDAKLIASINAYTGAFAIARALKMGADIVITGRCVDSALTLGACIHAFGWQADQLDLLASGSLAGHIIECGVQACGGNFTDWHLCAPTMENIGYPIVEMEAGGDFCVTKPAQTGGLVSTGTVGEQILYEIGDPQKYILPDVTCDFSQVRLEQAGTDRVEVRGALGKSAPQQLKASVTWQNGFRGGQLLIFYGNDADKKAEHFCAAVFRHCDKLLQQAGLCGFSQTSVEVLGAESQFGVQARNVNAREVVVKIAARHEMHDAIALLLREITGLALAGPPGLSGFAATRPRPSPVIALFSCLIARDECLLEIQIGGNVTVFRERASSVDENQSTPAPFPNVQNAVGETCGVPLFKLAFGRSGDKGNKANIGVMARQAEYLPYICEQLSEQVVSRLFGHFFSQTSGNNVQRFFMPGLGAINFVLENVLDGGGTSSLRNDPQAKGYAQILLAHEIQIPIEMGRGLL